MVLFIWTKSCYITQSCANSLITTTPRWSSNSSNAAILEHTHTQSNSGLSVASVSQSIHFCAARENACFCIRAAFRFCEENFLGLLLPFWCLVCFDGIRDTTLHFILSKLKKTFLHKIKDSVCTSLHYGQTDRTDWQMVHVWWWQIWKTLDRKCLRLV